MASVIPQDKVDVRLIQESFLANPLCFDDPVCGTQGYAMREENCEMTVLYDIDNVPLIYPMSVIASKWPTMVQRESGLFMDNRHSIALQKQHEFKDLPKPELNTLWKHYKGATYRVVGFSMREEDYEMEVLYKSLNNPMECPWARKFSLWAEVIEKEPGVKCHRFTEVEFDDSASFK